MTQSVPEWQQSKELPKVTCSSYDCENDLHSFRRKRPADKSYRNGRCVACNVDLVDWSRVDRKDLADVDYMVSALEKELIRHFFWHRPIDERAVAHAQKKGRARLSDDVQHRLEKYVSRPSAEIFRDGTQTPLQGNIIYYAQHATACCCRKCMEEWHGIDRNRALTAGEIAYFKDLIMAYIDRRMPAFR